MGSDGHTASLFPCSNELTEAMDPNYPNFLISTNPKNAPYERISLSAKTISNSKNIYLHLNGSEKLQILETALSLKDINKMPIYNFLKKELDIYWSP
jgi:6-phosphogluconolactonase